MKPSKNSLRGIWQKLLGKKPPTRPPAAPRDRKTARPMAPALEPLEHRVAPATLLPAGNALTYQDADGDTVTVKFSRAIFNPSSAGINTALDNVFTFTAGDGHSGNATPQQLQALDLTKVPLNGLINPAAGVSITVSVVKGASGDGFTDIGAIKAAGLALGSVSIPGDLGQIDAGTAMSATAIKVLTAKSFGAKGLTTQVSGGTETDAQKLESAVTGRIGRVAVAGDFGGYLHVVSGTKQVGAATVITAPAKIGSITIGGSLRGAAAAVATSDNTGRIQTDSDIGAVKIGTLGADGIVGGGGVRSGTISSAGKIASVTVTGGLNGGTAIGAGAIIATGAIGPVKIGTVGAHGITGGGGANSGAITAGGKISSVTLSAGLVGGTASGAGTVFATGGIGPVKISGDVMGGTAAGTGIVDTDGALGRVIVLGKVAAGTGIESGLISSAGKMGPVNITGDVTGVTTGVTSNGMHSGGVAAGGKLASVTIGGALLGGNGFSGGFVESSSDIGFVKITGEVVGGGGDRSGSVFAGGQIKLATFNGSLTGGIGAGSGSLFSGTDPLSAGKLVKVKILGSLTGGAGLNSGSIIAGGVIGSATIGKTGLAVPALHGGNGPFSGAISSDLGIALVKIVGDVVGGGGNDSGSIQSHGLLNKVNIVGKLQGAAGIRSGSIVALDDTVPLVDKAGDLGAITISGLVSGGDGKDSGTIRADGNLKSLTVASLTGGVGAGSGGVHLGDGLVHPGNGGAIKILGAFAQLSPGIPGAGSASIVAGGKLASVAVTGAATGAAVHVGDSLGSLSIGADATNVNVTARGQVAQGRVSDVAIGRIDVKGSVLSSTFLAGYDLGGSGANPDAQIGLVKVGASWTASNLVAGVIAGADAGFGNALDVKAPGADNARIVSRIASVIIGGTVNGTAVNVTDHFGFVAQDVGVFKIAGVAHTVRPVEELGGANNDVSIREVAV